MSTHDYSITNEHSFVDLDTQALNWSEQYKLMSSLIIPRPIALVSTDGPRGANAAPFSAFNFISVDPPMLMFSVGPTQGAKAGEEKDTLANVRATREFVVNVVDMVNIEKMNICAPEYGAEVNEMELAGFTSAPSMKVKPVRIVDVPVQLECKVTEILEFGKVPYYVVIGEVVAIHCRNDVINVENKHIDLQRLDLVGRLMGPGMYASIRDNFRLDPPRIEI